LHEFRNVSAQKSGNLPSEAVKVLLSPEVFSKALGQSIQNGVSKVCIMYSMLRLQLVINLLSARNEDYSRPYR
jgi:hypothetical protein